MSATLSAVGVVGDSRVHRLDPRAKIAGLLGVTLVAVSTPPEAWPAWVACAAALVAVAVVARVPARVVWRRARLVLPLVGFVALFSFGPLAPDPDPAAFAAVATKALIGTVAAVLLAATTSFPAVLRGLEALRVPRLFTLIAAFMYRYAFVIADEVRRMRTALAARGFRARSALGAGAIGRVVAALFLRSYSRAERVHLAMTARGYAGGRMPATTALAWCRADMLFVVALALVLLPARVLA